MSRGFLVLAPEKGGVKSYLNTGENGFLINTANYQTMIKDAEEIIYISNLNNDGFKMIQQAGKDTIEKDFSIEKIATIFTKTYLNVLGERLDEV